MKTRLAIIIVLLLAACSSPKAPGANPTASAANPNGSSANTVAPGGTTGAATLPPLNLTPATPAASEMASLSGNAPATGQPFTVKANSILRVNWQQASSGAFVLAINNTDPALAETANGRVVFEDTTGPSAMSSDYLFIPGQYTISVESADGPWKVWVQYVGPGE